MPGLIPQPFINDLLARIDIVDVVEPRLTLKKSGSRYVGLCPFHNEKTPSFNVVPDRQFYYCFGCGATGTALKFLMQHDRLDFVTAVETLAAIAGVEVPRERSERDQSESDRRLYAVLEKAEKYFRASLRNHPGAARAVDYLKRRGVSGVIARDFGIGYAPPGWDGLMRSLSGVEAAELLAAGLAIARESGGGHYDRFRDRIMFPIRDVRGRVVGFGGRVLGDEQPKYLNSPETAVFHKGRELYGLYEARRTVRNLESVVLVEGYMDVVALVQAGISNVVATLGTATGTTHFEKLFRYVPAVVCCFDGDAAGREAAWKALAVALPTLSAGRHLAFVFLPEREDPDSLVRREGRPSFEARIEGAVSAAEYLFQRLSRGIDLGTVDGRARLADLALPYLSRVPEGSLRTLMMQKLGEMTRLDPARLQTTPTTSPRAPASAPRPRARGEREGSRLTDLVLAALVQCPGLFSELGKARRAELAGLEDSLLGGLARFLEEHPEADAGSVLGYWAGDPDYDRLLAYAERPLILTGAALKKEIEDAVDQWLTARSKASREAILEDLRREGSLEKLEAYWQLKSPIETRFSKPHPE
jgi:DNA primase